MVVLGGLFWAAGDIIRLFAVNGFFCIPEFSDCSYILFIMVDGAISCIFLGIFLIFGHIIEFFIKELIEA